MQLSIRPFLLGLLAPLTMGFAAESPTPSKPNIVYILADDMGYADAGFMGCKDIQTPNLDSLAKAGAVLESFYVQSVCSPTRAALLTGRHASHTGIYNIVLPAAKSGLPLEERTLAQTLGAAGYQTAMIGKWHLGESQPEYLPTKRGFDHQYGLWFGAVDYFTHLRNGTLDWHRNDQPCHEEGYSTHLIAKEACRIIREKKPEKPLFLYLPFNAVHAPLQVPEQYTAPYASLPEPRRTYAGMTAAMDEAIGQVVDALKEKGLLDNTLIIFSSDNGGWSHGRVTDNRPLRAGKATIFEGGVRVCALACWPGQIPSGLRIQEPLHVVDWYPTLVKLAGGSLEQPLPVDGLDIWPVLTQGAKSPHDAVLICGRTRSEVALRMGDWKLLLNAELNPGGGNEDGEEQKKGGGKPKKERAKLLLFNLSTDIGETTDLSAQHPEKVKELRAKLNALMQDAVDAPSPKTAAKEASKPEDNQPGN